MERWDAARRTEVVLGLAAAAARLGPEALAGWDAALGERDESGRCQAAELLAVLGGATASERAAVLRALRRGTLRVATA